MRRAAFGGANASLGALGTLSGGQHIHRISPSSSTAGTAVMEPEVQPFASLYVEPLLDGLQATVVGPGMVVPLGVFGDDAHEHHKLSARAARAIARHLDGRTDSTG